MSSDSEKLGQLLESSILEGVFRKAVLSKPCHRGAAAASRIDVRPVKIRGDVKFQFTRRVGNQEQHQNCDAAEAITQLRAAAGADFRDVSLWTDSAQWAGRYNRKGMCRLQQVADEQQASAATAEPPEHNRRRNYLIPEGRPVPFLIETGIMTADGKVRTKHFNKFRQINRYVEFVRDVADHLPSDGVLRIVDFGCGKSYLTFATHYFFTQVQPRDVQIVGLDRRPDVVATCQAIVKNLSLEGLSFETGDIAGYRPSEQIHLAVSLHACDTATDDALAIAASWKCNVILAVPCCQHELAATLSKDRAPLFSEHGILHEKFSALATDALRANLMECAGYRTQVVEFIDLEHTPKNLLIRAIRRPESPSESAQSEWIERMVSFSEHLALPPLRLQRKLEEYGLLERRVCDTTAASNAE